jgi:hypothetical protein
MSAASPSATSAIGSSVAGLTVAKVRPLRAGTHCRQLDHVAADCQARRVDCHIVGQVEPLRVLEGDEGQRPTLLCSRELDAEALVVTDHKLATNPGTAHGHIEA